VRQVVTKWCPATETCPLFNPIRRGKTKARLYHAGCPVCVAAERSVAAALDPARFDVEIVHLGQQKSRVAEAEKSGVKSVPALVLEGTAFHINFGADLGALK
jgi:glutaredoxin